MAIGVLGGYLCRLIEFVLLAVSITLSVTTALLVIGVKSDFRGNCPLFPTVPDWNFFQILFNDVSNCNYIIGISSVGAIVAAIAGIYVLIECIRGKHIFWAVPFVQMIVYALFGVMIGGAAALLAAGFKDLCNDLLMGEFRTHDNCKAWQNDYRWKQQHLDGSRFYNYLLLAEVFSWAGCLIWVVLAVAIGVKKKFCSAERRTEDDVNLIF